MELWEDVGGSTERKTAADVVIIYHGGTRNTTEKENGQVGLGSFRVLP